MIPRILVPVNVRPLTEEEARKRPTRVTTYMDDRTVVPTELSDAPPLDGRTTIPSHLPLGVLVDRTLVARGMSITPIERIRSVSTSAEIVARQSRIVVPAYVEPPKPEDMKELEHAPELTAQLREVVEMDIFLTGDANLLMEAETKTDSKSDLVTRVLSVAVHIALIIFLVFTPKIFPAHVPTQQELEMARQALNFVQLPSDFPKTAPAPHPKVPINRETLRKVAPPVVEAPPQPAPPARTNPQRPPTDLPEAPKPQLPLPPPAPQPAQPTQPAPSHLEPIQPASPQPTGRLNLQLPQASPGKAMQDQIQDAIRRGGNQGGVYNGGPSAPGTGGTGNAEGYQILSDTQGVDFTSYIQRLLATLKRNWYAVMPQSANMGDKGVVSTTFQINSDGSVPSPDPTLERTSGKEPLDNAAMSAIHASNPFEPLPPQFHGPYLKLRIYFIYNIPPDQVNLH